MMKKDFRKGKTMKLSPLGLCLSVILGSAVVVEIIIPLFVKFHGDVEAFWNNLNVEAFWGNENFPFVSTIILGIAFGFVAFGFVMDRFAIEKAKRFKTGKKNSEAASYGYSIMSAKTAISTIKQNPNADISKLQEVVENRSLEQLEVKWLCQLVIEVPEANLSSIVKTLERLENFGRTGATEEFFKFLRENNPEVADRIETGVSL